MPQQAPRDEHDPVREPAADTDEAARDKDGASAKSHPRGAGDVGAGDVMESHPGDVMESHPGDVTASHALGTGAGAGAGAALGAAIGATLGPAGAAVGATFGALGGGAAGRAVAAATNPAEEDSYWRDHYLTRPYADDTLSYDHYRPAYRYGWEARTRHAGLRWDEVERELERGWRENRGASRLGWSDARQAARDAWQRVEHRMMDERERNASGTPPADSPSGDPPADSTDPGENRTTPS
jgi:hypothetical protein